MLDTHVDLRQILKSNLGLQKKHSVVFQPFSSQFCNSNQFNILKFSHRGSILAQIKLKVLNDHRLELTDFDNLPQMRSCTTLYVWLNLD